MAVPNVCIIIMYALDMCMYMCIFVCTYTYLCMNKYVYMRVCNSFVKYL